MTQLSTRLTEKLDLDVPLVQAPIGSATCPELAGAVADAGALGMLAVTWRDEEDIRTSLSETFDRTDGTVGVNIVLDPEAKSTSTERQVNICLDEGVEVFSFSFGDASPYVEEIHDRGGTVIQTVGSAEEATRAVEAGVDIVVAQGWEAGGHVQSEVATLPLVPRVVDAVPDTPVIAAGGIGDGRGIAAALALGADGAWLGTRFLATEEAHVHRAYRDRVLSADESETVFGTPFDEGWPEVPHRVLENETVERWEDAGRPEEGRPGEGETVAETPDGNPVRRYEDSLAAPEMDGNIEELPLYAGQSAGLADDLQPATELVDELETETLTALSELPGVTRRRG
jgi:nitronate monooxygenase